MVKNDKKEIAPSIEVNTRTIIGSVYSQLVSVTVSDLDVTIEFAYVNPRDKKGELVSRVTLPKVAGESLANLILKTIKEHTEKKGGKSA
ncbi:hypothetical protein A3A54_01055 [Candidatus Curtissbacteria bacterium RIFCSPLOWO2_01_FULL_39_62]|uniref:DUF3467 domain-containing protein n=2 Tax=Candidatus Curtissiibacteriota TaxID=1752717 RepID=A0A1F5GAK5_9BACT|nr:MAG: hypothetical protein A3D04_03755 [Candidatus Curtissbacteria bacterium RIFCSPHIGHO2_02_FULL_40_16b]OGD91040.1 MAG: hypothetical protein A3E11_00185 [Candidatus Curtissbacteria bacterium RIFCSPHIGHO2_12_FULL_38_37]OGD99374.1 MAG: hypothetical protein A3J17_02385 [Candidatus Curtissbacteria bacterium RIFCSPLOWO2_02_FULL_40_11]OGE01404.1 MAG: hypothetical protein A3A54_01055 [Candidatus Curtissbacteria bacterium RIFCSPLOWO2_01_FULL_39_62]OGE14233.1 MAG: hypothetical protein A3G14_04290 [Ca